MSLTDYYHALFRVSAHCVRVKTQSVSDKPVKSLDRQMIGLIDIFAETLGYKMSILQPINISYILPIQLGP